MNYYQIVLTLVIRTKLKIIPQADKAFKQSKVTFVNF